MIRKLSAYLGTFANIERLVGGSCQGVGLPQLGNGKLD